MTTPAHESSDAVNPTKHVGALLIVAALAVTAVGLTNGRMTAEKVVTDMVMPCGVTWLALSSICYFALVMRQRFLFLISFLTWLLFSLGSNDLVATRFLRTLEADYVTTSPLAVEDPFDVIVVLGGGSSLGANGELQLGPSGDRIALAARMYHAEKTQSILCSGSKIEALSHEDRVDVGEESARLLSSLGVPAGAIETIPGRNTSEEIEQLASFLADRPDWRAGLLTSAWHLPRAMRLARKADLEVEPLPADFLSAERKLTIRQFTPSELALYKTRLALHEYLAKLVGR